MWFIGLIIVVGVLLFLGVPRIRRKYMPPNATPQGQVPDPEHAEPRR